MRDILRWVLRWLSSHETTPPHIVSSVVQIRADAAANVAIRETATNEVEL
jgi:hypothetical protein